MSVEDKNGSIDWFHDVVLPKGKARRIWGNGSNMDKALFESFIVFKGVQLNARIRELNFITAAIDVKKNNNASYVMVFQAQVEYKLLAQQMYKLGARNLTFTKFVEGVASQKNTARAMQYVQKEAPTSGSRTESRFSYGEVPHAIATRLLELEKEMAYKGEVKRLIGTGVLPKNTRFVPTNARLAMVDSDEEAQVESDEEEEEVESEEEEVQDEVVEEEEEEEAEEEEEDEEEVAEEEEEELSEMELMRKLLGLYGTTMTEVKVQNRLLIGNYDALQKQNEVLVVTNDTTLHRNQKLTEQLARLSRKYTKAKEELDHWEHSFFPIADESFRFFQQFRMAAKERKETLVAFQGLIANIKNMDHDEDDNVKTKKRLVSEIRGIRAELVRLQPALEASVELMRKDRANFLAAPAARAHDAVVQQSIANGEV